MNIAVVAHGSEGPCSFIIISFFPKGKISPHITALNILAIIDLDPFQLLRVTLGLRSRRTYGYSRTIRVMPSPRCITWRSPELHTSCISTDRPKDFIILRTISILAYSRTMSYISVPKGSHFSIKNIPFGIFSSRNDSTPRPATAIGEFVLDLSVLAKEGAFSKISGFDESTLRQVKVSFLFGTDSSLH